MDRPPRLSCPQCGHGLRDATVSACPECGFCIGPARVRHRGALRYWHLLRRERWLDILLIVLWFMSLGLGYRVVALSPRHGIVVLALVAGAGVVGLGYYLRFRRRRRR